MSDRYVINADNTVSRMDDLAEWAKRFETDVRHVARTVMPDGRWVSTVFLGLDHGLGGPVKLFETLVFGPKNAPRSYVEEWGERCGFYDQALKQHERGVVEAKRLSGMSEADTPETTFFRQPSSSSSS